jgi:putative aldouronate transport system permease protein
MGSVMEVGFDQLFLMGNAGNRSVADVLDVFVYREGIERGNFSYTAAVGLFQSLICMILIFSADRLAKAVGESGIF